MERLNEFHRFANELVLKTALGAILGVGITSLVQILIAMFAAFVPALVLPIVEIIGASAGLWWVSRGKEKN